MAPTHAQPLAWTPQGTSGHHRARAVSPRGTGTSSGDSTALVVVGPAAPAGGQVVTGPGNDSLARLGRSGATGTPEVPGAGGVCLFLLETDVPHPTPPHPPPSQPGLGAPLPLQGWAGRVPEGLLARCAQTEKLGATGQRGSSLPLTSLGCPKQSQRALSSRCAHLRGRAALGLDGSASPGPGSGSAPPARFPLQLWLAHGGRQPERGDASRRWVGCGVWSVVGTGSGEQARSMWVPGQHQKLPSQPLEGPELERVGGALRL